MDFTENITMNNHQAGVNPSFFSSNPNLSAFFTLLSTNVDREGRPFASSMEGGALQDRHSFVNLMGLIS